MRTRRRESWSQTRRGSCSDARKSPGNAAGDAGAATSGTTARGAAHAPGGAGQAQTLSSEHEKCAALRAAWEWLQASGAAGWEWLQASGAAGWEWLQASGAAGWEWLQASGAAGWEWLQASGAAGWWRGVGVLEGEEGGLGGRGAHVDVGEARAVGREARAARGPVGLGRDPAQRRAVGAIAIWLAARGLAALWSAVRWHGSGGGGGSGAALGALDGSNVGGLPGALAQDIPPGGRGARGGARGRARGADCGGWGRRAEVGRGEGGDARGARVVEAHPEPPRAQPLKRDTQRVPLVRDEGRGVSD